MASARCEMISKKFVKPSSPTPPSLRNFKLSLFDQPMTDRFIPMAFFYPRKNHNLLSDYNTSQISSLLETTLSKTLVSYYPFAGRFKDNYSINCNDMGATFLEATINCSMSEILKETNTNVQKSVFPSGLPWSSGHDQPSLVVAQLSHFDCGGIAVSLCMSHKIGDAHTMCRFMNDWAAMTRQSSEMPSPQFIGESILPPIDNPSIVSLLDYKQGNNSITKRYIFDADKINQLKAKASVESRVENPTRVEVVSALLYKCAISASMARSRSSKQSVLVSMLNLRPLIGPPITQNYAGNMFVFFPVLTTSESEINFSRLVSEIRKAKVQNCDKYKSAKTDELVSKILEAVLQYKELQDNNNIDEYDCTSWCRFPTYDIDFGWGKPTRVSLASPPYEKYFLLIDNCNMDGIEALVNLPKDVMLVFESDPELLTFASPDSSF